MAIDWKGLATGIGITLMVAGIFSFLNYLWLSPMIDETLKTADCDKDWKKFIGDTEEAERKTCSDWDHIVSVQNPQMHQFGFVFAVILAPGGVIFLYFFTLRMHLKDEPTIGNWSKEVQEAYDEQHSKKTLPKGFDDNTQKEST